MNSTEWRTLFLKVLSISKPHLQQSIISNWIRNDDPATTDIFDSFHRREPVKHEVRREHGKARRASGIRDDRVLIKQFCFPIKIIYPGIRILDSESRAVLPFPYNDYGGGKGGNNEGEFVDKGSERRKPAGVVSQWV